MEAAKLTVLFLGIVLTISTQAAAGQSVVNVGPPSGKDDTANIQVALNACVAHGPDCTVQLLAGRYLTRQLVTYNFRGTFKGMGVDSTTIEALHNLPVNPNDISVEGECLPNTTTCLWPSLIIFVDGDIHVSDLSIRITSPPGTATTGWGFFGLKITTLVDALRFMGQHPTNTAIDRITIEGLPDNSSTSFGAIFGFPVSFNVVNGVIYTGELPRSSTPFDYYFLSGTLTVRNSSFKTMIDGVSTDGFRRDNLVTLGGSPSAGNHFENVYVGMDLETSESSIFDISHNDSSGFFAGMWVVPWLPVFVPSSPSRYLIHDNKFSTTGPGAQAVFLQNDPTNPWIDAMIWNNSIENQDSLSDGIDAYSTKGTLIWNNTVTGSGYDGIGLRGSTLSTVIGNNLSGFTPDTSVGLADIYLDPSTTHDLAVCSSPSDTVLNQGSNNFVVGCQQPEATLAAPTGNAGPTTSESEPNLPRRKPIPF
jgi:parallel beta-helix repeat protein